MTPVSLIVQMAGADRPGLVESLSTAISTAGGNWEGSRMARLTGHFAGVVNVRVAADQVDALKEQVIGLSDQDLLVSVVEVSAAKANETENLGTTVALEVMGQDRTGIVKEISQALTGLNVNVEELTTECLSAPMSGEKIFDAMAIVSIPNGVSEDQIREAIESIAQDLAVSISDLED